MSIEISVLSDVRRVSQLLARARVERIDVSNQRDQSTVRVALVRAKVESLPSSGEAVPVTSCELVLNAIDVMQTLPRRFEGDVDTSVIDCDSVKGGYVCHIATPEGQDLVLEMASLKGCFRDI